MCFSVSKEDKRSTALHVSIPGRQQKKKKMLCWNEYCPKVTRNNCIGKNNSKELTGNNAKTTTENAHRTETQPKRRLWYKHITCSNPVPVISYTPLWHIFSLGLLTSLLQFVHPHLRAKTPTITFITDACLALNQVSFQAPK